MSNIKTKTPESASSLLDELSKMKEQDKVGKFITFDTIGVKGLRINLEKIRNYARNGETSVQISYDNGQATILQYHNEKDTLEALARLDQYCL